MAVEGTVRKIIKALLPYGIVYIVQNTQRQKFAASFFFEVHVVEHCNLNCNGCSHFSCLTKEEYLDTEIFDKDCKRISEITQDVSRITLLGGEPLLHPKLMMFFEIIRKYFNKKIPIQLLTNGILLAKQNNEFWDACSVNNVYIDISNYPVKIDTDAIKNAAIKYNVKVCYNNSVLSTDDPLVHLMYKVPLDLEGRQNIGETYAKCPHPGCITLRDGKIYRCCTVAHIKFFNKQFGTNLQITEGDYIDIYKTKNSEELLNFLRGPFPFCRYCKAKEKVKDIKWAVTKKNITEWV
jgi:MoaA/NifB/PqqE/SkfB family radical SAM enzyme